MVVEQLNSPDGKKDGDADAAVLGGSLVMHDVSCDPRSHN